MILLPLAASILGSSAPAAKTAWLECMLSYAQVEAFGARTAAEIALSAQTACRSERTQYQRIRVKSNAPNAHLRAEDQDLAKRVIAFVRSMRAR